VILAHRAAVQLDGSDVSQRYLVVNERANASTRVVVHRLAAGGAMPAAPLGPGEVVSFDEAVYRLSGGEAAARAETAVLKGCSVGLFHQTAGCVLLIRSNACVLSSLHCKQQC
jgi:protease II